MLFKAKNEREEKYHYKRPDTVKRNKEGNRSADGQDVRFPAKGFKELHSDEDQVQEHQ